MMMMWMLFVQQPRRIVQLGLGSAALTKFCYQKFPDARVTAAELNPNVIAICHAHFGLPPNDARLDVREMDALDFVMDRANHGTSTCCRSTCTTRRRAARCSTRPSSTRPAPTACADGGVMTANVFGDFINYDKNLQAMEQAFDAVVWLPEVHDANIVVIAFKEAPQIDFALLYERAGRDQAALQPAGQGLGQWPEGVDARPAGPRPVPPWTPPRRWA
jgi:spermidine synthase